MTEETYEPKFLLPQSDEAERGLICSFLLSPQAVGAIYAERGVGIAHFLNPGFAEMFSQLMEMWTANTHIDIITLTQKLRDRGVLDACGGAYAVTELFTYLPTAANCSHYIAIAEDKRILREIAKLSREYLSLTQEQQDNVTSLLDGLSARLTDIVVQRQTKTQTLNDAIKEKIDRIVSGKPDEFVVKTGLSKLDYESPMHHGSMPMISGERKSGKSILALTIAGHIACESGPVLYFSLEDPVHKVVDRLLANASAVPMARDCIAALKEDDMGKLRAGVERLRDVPLVIRDDAMDLSSIVAIARQFKAKHPDAKLIVVDYAQLVRANAGKGSNREQEVALVSRTLRLLSIELGTAMLVLVQLNKEGDTRESKSLEQDCTAMWKLVCLEEKDPEYNSARILTIPFQRNGERGLAFKLAFLGHIARFATYSEKEPNE